MKKQGCALLALMAFLLSAFSVAGAAEQQPEVVIKMATLAPKGSNSMNAYEDMVRQIRAGTGGKVDFKIYWGGVQGDEKDVLRKIKLGQLHGGSFMGPGLGEIVPEVRVTEIPYIFRNHEEIAYVRAGLEDTMGTLFEEKGFVVLGWMDMGFVYTFSKVPLTSLEVARKQKWWTMEGEPVGREIFKTLGISPISLSVMDVAVSLSANMIDAANATLYGAVTLQWYSKFKYINELPASNLLGGTIVSRKIWDRISPENRQVIMRASHECHRRILEATRKEEADCLRILLDSGIKVVHTSSNSEKDMSYIFDSAKKTRENLVGRLYSRELLDRTLMLLEQYRRIHPKDTAVIHIR